MASATAFAAPDPVASAVELIAQGKSEQALDVLRPWRGQREGQVDFDYALALATLDSGDAATATLIFERILLLNENFHGARIDLGRAFFELGRLGDARREFDLALRAGPPEAAAKVVNDYLATIDRRERRARFSKALTLSTRTGYDSNVNSATDIQEFLGFGLSENSREQDSEFFETALTARGAYRPRPKLRLSGRLGVRLRRNSQASFANSDVGVAQVRLDHVGQTQRRSLGLQAFSQFLDGSRNSSAVILSGDWRFRVNDSLWVGPAARVGVLRYENALAVKDVNQWAAGALAQWQFGERGQGALESSVYAGRDRPQQDNSRYGRDFTQWSANVRWAFNDRVVLAFGGVMETSDFDEVFFEQLFDEPREDTAFRLRSALDWQFARRWRFAHSLSYRLNDTDIDVFEFERFEVAFGLRYVWR
ncbi:MAG: tetratricopeptide repeat protein [Gammaproteobacteria bacterium]